jgi:uncharacterized protein YbjT (DUF2867 family)
MTRVLVTAGTGTIGTELVAALLAREVDVRVLTRSDENARRLPDGARPVVGDLHDVDFMAQQMSDVDALFLNCPVGLAETYQGLIAADLAKRAGVHKLVYLSGQDPEGLFVPPHCGVKLITERVVKSTGVPYTILRPNTFMQNDRLLKDFILQGSYPLPLGEVGVSRVDVRDIAEVATIALTTAALDGETLTIAGPEPMTSATTAEAWSKALGRPVEPVGDIDTFEDALRLMLSPIEARDVWLMYEHFNIHGFVAPPGAIERLTDVLGRPPGSFTSWTQQMAAAWT